MKRAAPALIALLALAAPTSAQGQTTATNVRLGNHGTFVRTVVDFPAGGLTWSQYVVRDDRPFDGRAVIRVRRAMLSGSRFRITRARFGVTVRVTRIDDRVAGAPYLTVKLLSRPRTFAVLTWTSLTGNRLVIDQVVTGTS